MARRSLADRTAAVAGARGDHDRDPYLLLAGLAALALGAWADMLPVAVIGAAAVAWNFRPEQERAYLEGFADGLKYIDEADDPGLAPGPGLDRADLRRLPEGAGEDDRAGADGPRQPAGGAAAGPGPEPDLRSAFGLPQPEPRLARPALGADGQPVATADGPTRSGFPVIPAATESVGPISIGTGRPKDRRRTRSIRPSR